MKKLSIICALVMVFGVSLVQAQQYEVAPAGSSPPAFITTADVAPGGTVAFDIYLTGVLENQNAGGAWIDFAGSAGDLAYVSAGRALTDGSEGVTGPWDPTAGVLVNEPAGPGTVLLVVANLAGAAPDGENLIVGTATLQDSAPGTTGPDPMIVNITTIPSVATWTPIADTDVTDGQLAITEVCVCTTDSEADDGLFCNGVETCDPICVIKPGIPPCDDGDECTLDCDEDLDECLTDVCNAALAESQGPTGSCCAGPVCGPTGTDPQPICAAQFTLTKEDGYYQPAGEGEVVTIKNRICLNNPSDLIGGIQFDICDTPDCLTCIDCELTERTVMFDCVVLELPDGCCRVIMFCKNPGCAINPGECNIVTVVMQTNGNPDCVGCIDEELVNIVASDYDGFALAGSGVAGSLCPVVCGDVCPPGDDIACGDGVVDIYDIMCEVDLALTLTAPNECQAPRADVPTGTPPWCTEPDCEINILDIMVLIDMALNRQDCCSFFYQGIIY
jgi:hypothetical protein